MDPKVIRAWGQIIVSILSITALGYMINHVNDIETQKVIAGAIVGYAGAVVTFWVGSSAGSQTKDDVISASYPPPGAAPPPAPPPAPIAVSSGGPTPQSSDVAG